LGDVAHAVGIVAHAVGIVARALGIVAYLVGWLRRGMEMSGMIKGVGKLGACALAGLAVALSGLAAAPAQADTAVYGSSVRMVASGYYHNLYLKDDGTLWAWGDNSYGQLGDGTLTARKSPVKVMSDVKTVAAGRYHSLAVTTDNDVWAWGHNGYGQLGDGTVVTRKSPVKIDGLYGVKSVAAGEFHSLALFETGGMRAWGYNKFGQLCDGTNVDRHVPAYVTFEGTIGAVAAGADHTLLIADPMSEELYACGLNTSGQLGSGSIPNRNYPVKVVGMSGVKAVVGGDAYSMAVTYDGHVWAWGSN